MQLLLAINYLFNLALVLDMISFCHRGVGACTCVSYNMSDDMLMLLCSPGRVPRHVGHHRLLAFSSGRRGGYNNLPALFQLLQ